MNAYELADELQELDSKLHLINLFKSADMLRQQADRIAELEGELSRYELRDLEHTSRIAELEKSLSHWKEQAGIYRQNLLDSMIKPLTDEDIKEVYKQVSEPFGEKRLYEIHDFARAIEAKILGQIK